jgi:hypothetical protein
VSEEGEQDEAGEAGGECRGEEGRAAALVAGGGGEGANCGGLQGSHGWV